MSNIKVNSDLLKCENDFFTEESKTKSLLITKSAKKNAISSQLGEKCLKTEMISSSVLNRAKHFLDITKTDDKIADKCDLVDENDGNDEINDKQFIEMNLMLFENKDQSKDQSSDEEESESTVTSGSSSEDSEDDSNGSEHHSDNDTNNTNKDK